MAWQAFGFYPRRMGNEGVNMWIVTFFLSYLTDILPKKILARDYLKSLEQMQEEDADL